MNCFKAAFVGFVIALGSNFPSTAGDLEEGVKAYEQGDYKLAFQLLLPLAEQGVARAQNGIGLMYRTGRGVSHDDAQAAAWFQKAADQGYAKAQAHLGYSYRKGLGVPKDYVKAVDLLQTAAEHGEAFAQNSLGFMYSTGEGVARDDVKAAEFYRKAADQGDAIAQNNLATCMPQAKVCTKTTFRRQSGTGRQQTKEMPTLNCRLALHTTVVLACRRIMCRRTNGLRLVMHDIGLGMLFGDGKPSSFASR
jgi:TPR repeat protein